MWRCRGGGIEARSPTTTSTNKRGPNRFRPNFSCYAAAALITSWGRRASRKRPTRIDSRCHPCHTKLVKNSCLLALPCAVADHNHLVTACGANVNHHSAVAQPNPTTANDMPHACISNEATKGQRASLASQRCAG